MRSYISGFIERREVLALEVLDDGDLERRVVIDLFDHGRHGLQAGPAGGPPAALAGDELVATALAGTDQDRLEDAMLADRGREVVQGGFVQRRAGLVGIGVDAVDRHDAGCSWPWSDPRAKAG